MLLGILKRMRAFSHLTSDIPSLAPDQYIILKIIRKLALCGNCVHCTGGTKAEKISSCTLKEWLIQIKRLDCFLHNLNCIFLVFSFKKMIIKISNDHILLQLGIFTWLLLINRSKNFYKLYAKVSNLRRHLHSQHSLV